MALSYIKNKLGDYYLHEVNRGSFNQLGSYTTYQALYGSELFKTNHLYVIVGTDGGLLPVYINQCGVPQNSRYLFVELDHLWESVSKHPQLAPKAFKDHIDIVSEKNWYAKVLAWGVHTFLAQEAVSCLLSLSVQDPQDKQYMRLASHVFFPMKTLQRDFMHKQRESQRLIHQLTNLADNCMPINLLQGQYAGWPAIYLGAEKSLEKQLWELKPYLPHCFVMADLKSFSYLLSEEVYPHMVIAIDACEDGITTALFESEKPWPILLANSAVAPDLVGNWLGPHVYLNERFPWQSSMNIPNILWTEESTAAMGLKVLLMLGCDRLFFLGVDLCHDDPFLSLTMVMKDTIPYLHTESLAMTYGGEQRICDPYQMSAQKNMVHFASEAESTAIYNLSRDAIKISGIEYGDKTLLDTILIPQDFSLSHYHVNKLIHQKSRGEDLICCAATIKKYLEKLAVLEKIITDFFEQTMITYVSQKIEKEVTIESFRRILRKHYREETSLINTLMYKELLSFEIESKEDKAYTAIIAEGIVHIKNLLHDTLNRIKVRMEERNMHPHWYLITEQWKKDRQEGRSIVWRQNNLQMYAQLAGDNIRKLQQLEEHFLEKLRALREDEKTIFSSFSFHQVIALKRTFFQWAMNKNHSLLKQYIGYLEKAEDPDAQALKTFCQGLVAELEGHDNRAIECYLKATVGVLTEIALQQLTSLFIKHKDERSARRCLLCLGILSPGYLPQYAYYCSLIGDFHEATAAYQDYLKEVPEDLQANDIMQAMLK